MGFEFIKRTAKHCTAKQRKAWQSKASRIGLGQPSHFRAALVQQQGMAEHSIESHRTAMQGKAYRLGHRKAALPMGFEFIKRKAPHCSAKHRTAKQGSAQQSISVRPPKGGTTDGF